jgi:hypothetical protein
MEISVAGLTDWLASLQTNSVCRTVRGLFIANLWYERCRISGILAVGVIVDIMTKEDADMLINAPLTIMSEAQSVNWKLNTMESL